MDDFDREPDATDAGDPAPDPTPDSSSDPAPDPATEPAPPMVVGSDGRSRRRTALLVVGVAVATGLIGTYIGTQIQSPADRAAARAAPEASLITVPVERRALSSELILAGQVSYNEPTTVQLAGSVGVDAGEAAIVTDAAAVGDTLREGDVFVEITGRPVIVLQGRLPMYRRMVIGTAGPDVLQLEESLVRQGYPSGTVDTVFDEATASAVEQMYVDAGYTAEGPSVEERDALTSAQESVRSAEDSLRAAQTALADASRPMLESERLQITQAVESARQAVPDAQAAAQAARVEGDTAINSAVAVRDSARVARDSMGAARDIAAQPGAIDPDTGEPYTAQRFSQFDVELAQLNEALTGADGAVVGAQAQRDRSVADADQAIRDAEFQLRLAEAQYSEAIASGDDTALTEAVSTAQGGVDTATANLMALQAATGTRISPGELVFVPLLPSNVTESYVVPGSTVQGPIGTLATSETLVSARVSRVDSALVAVGAAVQIDVRGSGVSVPGTVLSVGAPPPSADGGDSAGGGGEFPSGGESTGRLEVVVSPDDPDALNNYVFWDTRVTVSVASTDGEVLVVPVAALTVGPDQVSQVEIERTPATATTPAVTEIVDVEVGLSANGLAEVRPIDPDSLLAGDRVVIGVETNERRNEDDTADRPGPTTDTDPDGSAPDDDGDDDGAGDDDGDGDDGDGDGDGDGDDGDGDDPSDADSPLAALMGWEYNPVEDRRKQLEVEERTATCMRDEGFEYQPVDYSAGSAPEDELRFTDPEGFGEKYGYGVMYSYELYETGDGPVDGGFEDPNQDYVMGLSPDEQEAFNRALYGVQFEGPPTTDGESQEFVPPPLEDRGCQGIAHAEVYGESPGDDPAVQEILGEFYENQQNDPRLADANRAWAVCLEPTIDEQGFPPPERPDLMYGIVNRLKAEAQGLEIIEVSSQEEFDEYMNSEGGMYGAEQNPDGSGVIYLGEPAEIAGDEIERLTAIEVELWRADQTCQDESQLAEIWRELELEVVDRITTEFPDLVE